MSADTGLRDGLVVATHGRHAMVRLGDGSRMQCHPRGRRQDCVVGDRVQWRSSGDQGVIEVVAPRRNLLFRQDAVRTKPFAANLDQILVLVAATPPFSESVLSRALIAAAAADIPVLLVLNKIDRPEVEVTRERLAPYRALGLAGLELSLKHAPQEARALILPHLSGRSTLVLGPSGMGKSTLINLMVPDAGAQTGEISLALNAGRHTTTATTWYAIEADGALIDSPGFQTFGLHHLKPVALAGLMPDLAAHTPGCRFSNCTHRQEPGCAVRAALQDGRISAGRIRVYEELFEELGQQRW